MQEFTPHFGSVEENKPARSIASKTC